MGDFQDIDVRRQMWDEQLFEGLFHITCKECDGVLVVNFEDDALVIFREMKGGCLDDLDTHIFGSKFFNYNVIF